MIATGTSKGKQSQQGAARSETSRSHEARQSAVRQDQSAVEIHKADKAKHQEQERGNHSQSSKQVKSSVPHAPTTAANESKRASE